MADAPAKPDEDVVVLGPPTPDGDGVRVLRARNDRLEAGELRALEEGRPVTGEIVKLEPRKDDPRICDVRESWRPPARASASPSPPTPTTPTKKKGPAQVASDAYRDGWDKVFDKSKAN